MQFHQLKISDLKKPIPDATTIQFELPEHLYDRFSFFPGQHLIIKFFVNGEEVRRSYSLNSCPYVGEPLEVTVKRVKGGLVSNYANDQLYVGDQLEVMIPQGRFYADIQEDDYKTYYLFAAGSGVTPIFSILKSVIFKAPNSVVYFFYGNKDQESILFKQELDQLEKQYSERLFVSHTLSHSKSYWSTWTPWKGRKGRIDAQSIEWFIMNYPPVAQTTEYYICGPGKMNLNIKNKLLAMDVPKEAIHIEQFGGAIERDDSLVGFENATLIAKINGQQVKLPVSSNHTILQALKKENVEIPYSCESGICGTCVAKVKKGEVKMKACMALEAKEIERGLILTCQGICINEEVEIEF